jgi:hypothetical protein
MRLSRIPIRVLVACAVPIVGCGNGPAEPSTIPNVAGNYSGSINIAIPQLLFNLTCPARALPSGAAQRH